MVPFFGWTTMSGVCGSTAGSPNMRTKCGDSTVKMRAIDGSLVVPLPDAASRAAAPSVAWSELASQ